MKKPTILILTIPDSKSGVSNHSKDLSKLLSQNNFSPFLLKHWRNELENDNKRAGYALCSHNNEEIEFDFCIDDILKKMYERDVIPEIIHVHTTTYESDRVSDRIMEYFSYPPSIYTLHAILKYINLDKKTKFDILDGKEFKIKDSSFSNEKAQERLIYSCDKAVLISDTHKKVFDRIYPEYANKSVSIPNFTDFYKFAEDNKEEILRKSCELREKYQKRGSFLFTYCGRLEKQKGIKMLMKILNEIIKVYDNAKILMIGSKIKDNDEDKKLLCGEYGLKEENKDAVNMTEWIKDPLEFASYLKTGDALIQPIVTPNLYSISTLESLSVDVPIISCEGELSFGSILNEDGILKSIEELKDSTKVKNYLSLSKRILKEKYSGSSFMKNISMTYKEILSTKNKSNLLK